ncbi:hypothetical protein PMAYCL1PPCAC_00480, partial [Pristionchus mayeri]
DGAAIDASHYKESNGEMIEVNGRGDDNKENDIYTNIKFQNDAKLPMTVDSKYLDGSTSEMVLGSSALPIESVGSEREDSD